MGKVKKRRFLDKLRGRGLDVKGDLLAGFEYTAHRLFWVLNLRRRVILRGLRDLLLRVERGRDDARIGGIGLGVRSVARNFVGRFASRVGTGAVVTIRPGPIEKPGIGGRFPTIFRLLRKFFALIGRATILGTVAVDVDALYGP